RLFSTVASIEGSDESLAERQGDRRWVSVGVENKRLDIVSSLILRNVFVRNISHREILWLKPSI
ncbi:MAG: hypothetical protein SXV54_28245, partial [Chloroflexota bacterium]|nr:hypothetical protein [Chloroflexota bacterium]